MTTERVLVTGATGYIGQSLIPRLLEKKFRVRCLVRNPERMNAAGKNVEVIQGDLLEGPTLIPALRLIDTAFYLAHSLDESGNFEKKERLSAENFAIACKKTGVRRIIFLGALGSFSEGPLSPHLKSRKVVGDILRQSGIQVIEFQASIILGPGSLSFEMVRALSERLPVMIMPRWVSVKAQPIAIHDVLDYLVQSITRKGTANETFQIGGTNQVSYKDLISEYCNQRGLQRWLIPVPVLTPGLSSLWLALVTPLYARAGRKLIESIKNSTVVEDNSAAKAFPMIRPMNVKRAMAQAIGVPHQTSAPQHRATATAA